MFKICTQCAANFEITAEDLEFYKEISPVFADKKILIPPPQMCPDCRHQRRLAFRNERNLYMRKCDLSGRDILSVYSADKPYKVYDQSEWWSDKWDAQSYGRHFDFNRPFFDQFRELYEEVPRVSLHTINAENSYYTCYTLNMKNCYLIFGAGNDEDCMYGKYIAYSKDCLDSLALYSCEFCYEGTASDGCYQCRYFTNSRNCSECTMVEDCIACKNCLACFGLRNKEYYVFNQYVGKEKYEKIMKEYTPLTPEKVGFLKQKLEELKQTLPHLASHTYNCEDCSGDALFNCKNCQNCFDCKNCEDCKYLYNSPKSIRAYDGVYSAPDGLQYCYNTCSTVGSRLMTTYFVWYCDSVYYSMDCLNSRNLFGCVGLRNKDYCIFNRQYTQEDYEKLVPKIIEHMGSDWGEYFPYNLAPCAYNETVAQEYFPLNQEQILNINAYFKEIQFESINVEAAYAPAENINDISDDICQKTLRCEITGRSFKILPAELTFYRKMGLPIPRRHPDQRHYDRLEKHNAYKLHPHQCSNCGTKVESALTPNFPGKIYCEKCYLQAVY